MSGARRNFASRAGEVINLLDKRGGRLVLARLDSGFLAHVARRSSGGPAPVAFEDVASGLLRVVHREVVIRFQPPVPERRRRAILGWFGFAVRRRNAFIPDQVVVCHPGGKYVGEELIEVSNLLTALDEIALATPNFVSQYRRQIPPSIRPQEWHLGSTGLDVLGGLESHDGRERDRRRRPRRRRRRGPSEPQRRTSGGIPIQRPGIRSAGTSFFPRTTRTTSIRGPSVSSFPSTARGGTTSTARPVPGSWLPQASEEERSGSRPDPGSSRSRSFMGIIWLRMNGSRTPSAMLRTTRTSSPAHGQGVVPMCRRPWKMRVRGARAGAQPFFAGLATSLVTPSCFPPGIPMRLR